MIEELKTLINHRYEKAQETLKEAQLLYDANRLFACINRLYYSCFYAVNALLLQNNLSSKTHKGVRNLFFLEYVNKGLVSKDWATFYSHLFDSRLESDYKDFYIPKPDEVKKWLEQCYQFLELIKRLIKI